MPVGTVAIQTWKFNSMTTTERLSLVGVLTAANRFLPVYDTDVEEYYIWDGTAWVLKLYTDPDTGGGGGLTAGDLVVGETPAGTINGSNATFTTAFNFTPGTVEVFINGILQKLITHYQTVGIDTILFTDSPQTGDLLLLNYIKA